MVRIPAAGAALAVVGAGTAAVRKVVAGRGQAPSPAAGDRWHSVTVALPPEEVGDPLTELRGKAEVRVERAPGDRGTELHARLRSGAGATRDEVRELREALRTAKMRLETGEVLRPSGPPTSTPTPLAAPLRAVTGHAREEGRL